MDLRERARRGYPDAMAALAEAGEDLSFLTPEQKAYGWAQTMHPRLAEGMGECDSPPPLALLVALKRGTPVAVTPELAPFFQDALGRPDPEVRSAAVEALRDIPPEIVDALCDRALTCACSPEAREAWVALGHLPTAPHTRQIYLIRMNLFDRAEELDPQGEHLVVGALDLRPAWRLLLAAILRERGRGHLVPRMLGIARDNVQLDGPMLQEMLRQKQLEALWTLAPFTSVERAREIILGLAERRFSGGESFARALELASAPNDERPVFTVRGKLLGWGGSRLYLGGKVLQAYDWKENRLLWRRPCVGNFAKTSLDGRWLVSGTEVLNSNGDPIGLRARGVRFSPCSEFCSILVDSLLQLWRLEPLECLEEHWPLEGDWCGPSTSMVPFRNELLYRDLRTGAQWNEPVPADDSYALAWRKSPQGNRWVAERVRNRDCLVVEQDGSSRLLPGPSTLLPDGRVLCGWGRSLWDGRSLRTLPKPEAPWLLALAGPRCVLRKPRATGLLRLGDSRPYRQFPGQFEEVHPTEDYLITRRDGNLHVWHAPREIPLHAGMLTDGAAQVEPPLRPLALFLLQSMRSRSRSICRSRRRTTSV